MFVTMVVYFTPSAQAQPACLNGDRIHRNTRITDAGNNCSHCTNNPPNVLLQLLHSSKPVLRLTNNNASGDCFNGPSGTLSVHHPGQALLSAREANHDYALVAASTANHLLLSTRNNTASIRFATTAPYDETSLGNTESGYVVGDDVERMRITPEGSIGIWQREPKEAVHVGKYTAIHLGHEVDMLGYNFVSLVGSDHRLLTGTSGSPGKAMKIGFSRHGYLELGAGSTEGGLADDAIDWYEGGSVFGAFAGLTIQNINGNGCASFGKYYPNATTRVYIKAFEGSTMTDALVAVSSTDAELMRVRNNGTVGIGQDDPKERLHVGSLITFHDGGSKWMGFNAYYDATAEQRKNMSANRASVVMGIGDGTENPSDFVIQIDEKSSVGEIMNTGFKGILLKSDGNVGIGTTTPNARLQVKGLGTSSSTLAVSIVNSSSSVLVNVQDDGNVGVGVADPSARLTVKGSGTTSGTMALSVANSSSSDILRVRNDGRVLIGTQTITAGDHTDFKLSVDGKVVARSYVSTETNWADDVFEPGYDLMPLDQLSAFIEENGHLPDVPTAADVARSGVDLTGTVVTLLRKVEELTLYVLELKRENDQLKKGKP